MAVVDLFMVYSFVKRLATPFDKWKAYETGVIDERGNILKSRKDRRTIDERKSFGKFDLLVLKLKKLLEKVPGGKTRLGSMAAALWLIKEHNEPNSELISEEDMRIGLLESMNIVRLNEELYGPFDNLLSEDAPVNSVGSGNIAGVGVGPKGEPGVNNSQSIKYKKKNKETKSFKRFIGKDNT